MRPAENPIKRRPSRGARRLLPFASVAVLALALRLASLPSREEVRDMDEIGYAMGGLVMWEGMAPGYQFAPAGPITWIAWAHAAVATSRALATSGSGRPLRFRVFDAVDSGLETEHADLRPLRRVLLAWSVACGVAGAVAAAFVGWTIAGRTGLVASGVLAAALPTWVELGVMSKPYADAWALATIAAALASSRRPSLSGFASALVMGASIGSRIDMVLVVPLVAWMRRDDRSGMTPVAWLARVGMAFLVVSPWFVTGLLGNLRTIVAVRLGSASLVGADAGSAWRALACDEGLACAVGLGLAGIARVAWRATDPRERRWTLALGAWLVLLVASALHGTAYGLRHQGAVLVTLVLVAPIGLREAWRLGGRRIAIAASVVVVAAPLVQGARCVARLAGQRGASSATSWIERNVAPGTIVYVPIDEERPPLPTSESGERLWRDAADPGAWRVKVRDAMRRHDFGDGELPPAMSEAHLVQERAFRRRWAILAGPGDDARPRYDVRTYGDASAFDVRERDVADDVRRTGGVVVERGFGRLACLGPPRAAWLTPEGWGCRIRVIASPSGPDVRASCEPPTLRRLR